MNFPKEVLGNVAVVLVGFLIGFLMLEGIIRFTQLFQEKNVVESLETINARGETVYKQNIDVLRDAEHKGDPQVRVYTNSEGFVGKEYAKKSNESRVVALGDSFTAAVGVNTDDNFVSLLERESSIPVMNFGVGGQGTVEQLLRYNSVASQWDHDLVLVFFYTNDFENNQFYLPFRSSFRNSQWQDIPLSNANNNLGRKDLKYLLLKNSEAIQLIDAKVRANAFLETLAVKIGLHSAGVMGLPTEGIHPAFFMYQNPTPPNQKEVISFTGDVFKTFKNVVEANGATLAVVYLPEAVSVDTELFEDKKTELPSLRKYQWDFDAPSKALNDILSKEGIPFLDLTPYFRDILIQNPSAPLYANQDGHFREEGHALVLREVLPFMQRILGN